MIRFLKQAKSLSPGLPFFIIIIFLTQLNFALKDSKQWYKGNLHTHSYWSDGDEFPEMIMDWYKSHGYNFLGLSDHNSLAQGEKWTKVQQSKLYEDGFEKYLAKFGNKVTYRKDSGRINVRLKTYEEYKSMFEDPKFLVIHSEEITTRLQGAPIHMNATNIQKLILPQPGSTVTEVMQNTVDAVLQQRKETGIPMFPHLNHPYLQHYRITIQDIIGLRGERFFEVYNGHPLVHNYGDKDSPGMEDLWDQVNIAYLNRNQPVIYGLATDDTHNYHQFGAAFSNAGRGWVMVRAAKLEPGALIEAMENGDFYSSTGVILEELDFSKNTLRLKVEEDDAVTYTIEFVGVKKDGNKPEVLKTVVGSKASFKVKSDYLFVRARVTSSKLKPNPFQEGDHEMAWIQPVMAR